MPHENITRMSIAVHVSMVENHPREDVNQNLTRLLRITELPLQARDVINLDSFNELHHYGPVATLCDIILWDVQVRVVPEQSSSPFRINYLGFEVELLNQRHLEVLIELSEVNALIIIPLAEPVGKVY